MYPIGRHSSRFGTTSAPSHLSNTSNNTAPPQPQTHTTATAPAQLPVPGPAKTYAEQVTIQQLLHSSKEAYSSIKEEVGLFIIRHFLADSQDGTTILLKTGGQVTITKAVL